MAKQQKKDRPKEEKPRAQTLGGMEDNAIPEIETAAHEYVEARDERMELTTAEVAAKGKLLRAMKKHKKERYERDEIIVEVVIEEETVKVRKRRQPKKDEE